MEINLSLVIHYFSECYRTEMYYWKNPHHICNGKYSYVHLLINSFSFFINKEWILSRKSLRSYSSYCLGWIKSICAKILYSNNCYRNTLHNFISISNNSFYHSEIVKFICLNFMVISFIGTVITFTYHKHTTRNVYLYDINPLV